MSSHKIIRVPVSEIFADYERNFRDPIGDYRGCLPTEGYDHDKFLAGNAKQGLFESIYHNGVITPIWVAVLTASQIEEIYDRTKVRYKYRVIRGHKRFRVVSEINTRFPGKIEELTVDAYEGLSELEEWEKLADHGETQREEPLSELGEFRAVVNLFAAGFSQVKIANMFGQKRGWSMRRVWLHQMGVNTPIEKHYLAKFDPKAEKGTFYTFPLSAVDDLHTAWTADNEAGTDPMSEGAKFLAIWNTFAETGKKPPEEKALNRKAIDERASFVKGRPALEEMVKFASGRGGNAKTAAEMYDRINAKAEKTEALQAELDTANATIADLSARIETAEATVSALTAERDSLKAELVEARKPTNVNPSRKGR